MFLDYDKLRVHMHLALRLLVHFALAAALLSATLTAPFADPRTPLPEHAGGWQRALFPLRIPVTRLIEGRMRHFTEHCTAIAVTPGPNSVFVSAWHCFENYRSTITPIQLIDPDTATPVPIKLLETGGSMQEDWALLTPDSAAPHRYLDPNLHYPPSYRATIDCRRLCPTTRSRRRDAVERYLLADLPAR